MTLRTHFFLFIFIIILLNILLAPLASAVNKIMPLGDSITQGNSSGVIPDIEENQVSYRKALYDRLKAAGYVVNDEIFVGTLFSGESFTDFDPDHDGHPAFTADQIILGNGDPLVGKLEDWLNDEKPNIVLLHIGTNDITNNVADSAKIETILDVIDAYEVSPGGNAVWVVLALIIDRSCTPFTPPSLPCPNSAETTAFNNAVTNVFNNRPAADKIILVNMQTGAGIDYDNQLNGGDMWDSVHPFASGYTLMADLWFSGLTQILPQADAGQDQNVNEFDPVTLRGVASDPNNATLSYQWVQTAGTAVVLSDDQAIQPTFDAPDAGLTGVTLTFMLTVTNEDELVATDIVDVAVAKILPQADAGPDQTVTSSAITTLDASGSTGVGLSYQWTQTAGTTVVLSSNQGVQPFFTAPPNVGTSSEILTFELTITDEDNVTSTDTVDITVKILPQADAGPAQSVEEFDQVNLDGSGSIAAGTISYQWTQIAGTGVSLSDAQVAQPTFTAPDVAPGSEILTFELTIRDEDNMSSSDRVNITVNNPSSSGGGGGGGGGGCFIASAAPGGITGIQGLAVAMIVLTSIGIIFVRRGRKKKG